MALSSPAGRVADDVAKLGGKVLAASFGALARVRPADKPLHPRGELFTAEIERSGVDEPVGVPWIDEPGTSSGIARVSRATGLPTALPDIYGLALRVESDAATPADLLFATTGLGRLSRCVLFPARHPGQRAYTTLLPYRTAAGSVTLAAIPLGRDSKTFTLACAPVGRPWRSFAKLRLAAPLALLESHDSLSFDPVLNCLPGLDCAPWVAELREGAYRAARRSRGDADPQPPTKETR